jgi:hypothetical protein
MPTLKPSLDFKMHPVCSCLRASLAGLAKADSVHTVGTKTVPLGIPGALPICQNDPVANVAHLFTEMVTCTSYIIRSRNEGSCPFLCVRSMIHISHPASKTASLLTFMAG